MMKHQTMKMHQTLKEEYDIWALGEWSISLQYIDNVVWKVIQYGISREKISTGKDGVIRIRFPSATATKFKLFEKERKAKNYLVMAFPRNIMRRFHEIDDAKDIWGKPIRTLGLVDNRKFKKMQKGCFSNNSLKHLNYAVQRVRKGDMTDSNNLLSQLEAPCTYSTCTPSTSSTTTPETERSVLIAMIAIGMKKFNKENKRRVRRVDGKGTYWLWTKRRLNASMSQTTGANEIYEKDEKLKKYRRIGMKAVKEKEQLQKTLDSWKDSSKNLWRLINSGMSSNSKVGLGYEIQSNNEVLSYEDEMNFSVFNCSEEDLVGKPLYSRFIKTNDFKGVPHPLSGDYTPTPQEEIDESLYVYGKKGPQEPEPSVSDDRSSEYSTYQSNDSG
ncbi:hypothetical protein Tco_1522945 [Tanacetum coccineum]